MNMALNVYLKKEEIPAQLQVINKNDVYFDGYTNLNGSEFEQNVLREIDQAHRVSELTFIGRTTALGALNKSNLSTGSKTLLNIYNNSDICFNVVECGDNALEFLCDLHAGHVLWEMPFINVERDEETCDIMCRGKHFDNICDFLDYDWSENDA